MNYAQIRYMDISNGEGIGVSLFVQGCKFYCYNCFNQETWDINGGKPFTDKTQKLFFDLIDHPYITRISFLGGSPLIDENVITMVIVNVAMNMIHGTRRMKINEEGSKI